MAVEFDVIPFEDINGKWKKLGSGSFGNVYKSTYLGIDVAIKEVLPSNEYDVSKYFDREWRLMKEARHPNVVLYIALSRAPQPDNRIFIISEFIENGNLRQYIYDKKKPLPWRLRLSFATDIVRAMAYLHARQCIHRDLKPENLLLTANGRIKVTDFGFARIVAQTAEETRRLTFCGTDSYMSPEILIGENFGLETDVYSLGIIFCELLARKLADDDTFKRVAPYYALDPAEVQLLADPEAPPAFVDLALACCSTDRFQRPTMVEILARLKDIEADVVARSLSKGEPHVGSIKFLGTKGKALDGKGFPAAAARPGNRRIPSFGMGIQVGNPRVASTDATISTASQYSSDEQMGLAPPGGTGPLRNGDGRQGRHLEDPSEDEEDEELEAILALNGVEVREGPQQLPTVDSEMSWRLTGWMKEYVDKIKPQPSTLTPTSPDPKNGTASLDASTESLLARVPLLPSGSAKDPYAMDVDGPSSSNASSALTIRPTPKETSEEDLANAKPVPRANHQREPNLNALPSMTIDTALKAHSASASEEVENGEAGAESYFTAATPSTFPSPGVPSETAPATTNAPANPVSAPTPVLASVPSPSPAQSPAPVPVPVPVSIPQAARPQTPPPRAQSPARPAPAPSTSFELQPRVHRFSLMKSGGGWSPLDILFGSALGTGSKCDLCAKRLGWKPCLECDDCSLTVHMKCGETAPMDCEVREAQKVSKPSKIPLRTASPKSKSNTSSPKSKSPGKSPGKSLKTHK